MNKKTNRLFLLVLIVHFGASILLSALVLGSVKISTFTQLLISELSILIPGFIFLLWNRYDLSEWVPFRKIRLKTVFLCILFTFLIMPLISLVNVFSQLFTTNEVVEMSADLLEMPVVILIFMVGVYGPFCEEFIFRGILYSGFKKSGSVVAAAVLSAVYFGLLHLNINQFTYALVLGFVFCMLNEATGSILSSMIGHIVVNSWNCILLIGANWAYSKAGMDASAIAETEVNTDAKLYMIGGLLIVSFITTILAYMVFNVICEAENRTEHVKSLFSSNEKSHLLTASGYVAIAVCVFIMLFLDKCIEMLSKYYPMLG